MENLAEIALDLILTQKFAPPEGYDVEDSEAMQHACWQGLCYSLSDEERAALNAVAKRHIEELELEPVESLPGYLQQKLAALKDLVAEAPQSTILR
ncbi:MAG: hypothetical protein O3C28_16935 [Proteobacteria bacterium]|nr:hypothetical protein [Pseudomonadota bacterium]